MADALIAREVRPMASAGALLGAGLGGLLQGIVLTALLQLHPVDVGPAGAGRADDAGMLAIGWLATVAGVLLTFRAARWREVPWSARIVVGSMLFGWGAFNLLEGVTAHHELQLHHVLAGASGGAWDLAFLVLAVTTAIVGWCLTRGPVRRVSAPILSLVPPAARRT